MEIKKEMDGSNDGFVQTGAVSKNGARKKERSRDIRFSEGCYVQRLEEKIDTAVLWLLSN